MKTAFVVKGKRIPVREFSLAGLVRFLRQRKARGKR